MTDSKPIEDEVDDGLPHLSDDELLHLMEMLQDPKRMEPLKRIQKIKDQNEYARAHRIYRRATGQVVCDEHFLRATIKELSVHGLTKVWVFGEWAEEMRRMRPVSVHDKVSLLLRDWNFEPFDKFLETSPWEEIPELRKEYRRAYDRLGITVEVTIAHQTGAGDFTILEDRLFQWPENTFQPRRKALTAVSKEALEEYGVFNDA